MPYEPLPPYKEKEREKYLKKINKLVIYIKKNSSK